MTEEATFCAVHPDRETGLRCNKCDRYMCVQCAVQTPVGYRCRECVRQQDDRFFNAAQNDAMNIFGVCAGLAAVAGAIFSLVDWILVAVILGFPVGGFIGEAAWRAVQRRKGRNNGQYGVAGVIFGGLAGAAIRGYLAYPDEHRRMYQMFEETGQQMPQELASLYPSLSTYVFEHTVTIATIIFVGIAAYAVYYRLKA